MRNVLIGAVLMLPVTGQAQQIVAADGTSVANFFLAEGFAPTIERDGVGDPLVEVEYYGVQFSVYFYGCTDGADCKAIQFFKGYRTNGSVRLSKTNQWNTERRYAVAYVSENGSARIEHDVFMGNSGLTPDDFAGLVGKWMLSIEDFEEFINW